MTSFLEFLRLQELPTTTSFSVIERFALAKFEELLKMETPQTFSVSPPEPCPTSVAYPPKVKKTEFILLNLGKLNTTTLKGQKNEIKANIALQNLNGLVGDGVILDGSDS
uniref:Uncharacterized protein n=1 Tax=Chromera velia CCMP2878 TaxID=1169474 RepID=A0A0G4FEB5_9ALVE|eukprot:Cvel_16466.t1-p1 / transcript=Cvel_16466.t1 / gene=Cvel_16466 / organism=Chromera_velia_CCMP2878 / gene_product=hypothetical protein / transcript_product=hypothetical protein / location=Cvel_scaffold1269:21247-21573(+) / protein_length=109 / sequence_SO=supercontig / SO=protein_coding / is_pseudo=false